MIDSADSAGLSLRSRAPGDKLFKATPPRPDLDYPPTDRCRCGGCPRRRGVPRASAGPQPLYNSLLPVSIA